MTPQEAFAHAEILFGNGVQVTQTVIRQGQTVTVECSIGYRRPEAVHIWKGSTFEQAIRSARSMPASTA